MDADALVADLRSRGIELRAVAGNLEVRPRRKVPSDLLEELRIREPEIVRRLTAPTVADAAVGGVVPSSTSELVAEVCAMRLDNFAHAGLVVTVWSEVLGERIMLASDNARLDPGELRPVYRARELWALLGILSADPHRAKQGTRQAKTARRRRHAGAPPSAPPSASSLPLPPNGPPPEFLPAHPTPDSRGPPSPRSSAAPSSDSDSPAP